MAAEVFGPARLGPVELRNRVIKAREAGFDAVELRFGHNYLVSSFLSPRLNVLTSPRTT